MRHCQRFGCENTPAPRADYCGPTCKREAARARAISRDEKGDPSFWHRYAQIRPARRCRTRVTAALALVSALLLLAGCGSGRTVTRTLTLTTASTTTVAAPAAGLLSGSQSCDPAGGQGHLGVCQPKQPPLLTGSTATVPGPYIPDVYEGNGCKSWASSKGHVAGGIVKAFEYRSDSCLRSNWAQLTQLGIWHAAYDFLRPGSCTSEADKYSAAVNAAGGFNSGPPIADAEVPLPAGFVACWVVRVEHDTGSAIVVVYTSPGTWPGGGRPANADLWEANYGITPDCVWTCVRVARQFTDGSIGPEPHCTPIGCGDVSQDTGITSLFAHAVIAQVRCFGRQAQPKAASCRRLRPLTAARSRKRDATIRAIARNRCSTRQPPAGRTYRRLTAWSATVSHRGVCGRLRQREVWFEARVHDAITGRSS